MDPNQNQDNTQQNTNPVPQASPPVQSPQAAPATPETPEPSVKKNNKMILYLIIVAVLILIAGFIFIFFVNVNSSAPRAVTNIPTIEVSPTQGLVSEEAEIDNIIIDDPDSEFSDVDKDLQGL